MKENFSKVDDTAILILNRSDKDTRDDRNGEKQFVEFTRLSWGINEYIFTSFFQNMTVFTHLKSTANPKCQFSVEACVSLPMSNPGFERP
jgi:hypothetical protein